MSVTPISKVGEGSYGRLYLSDNNNELVVVKRNLVDAQSDFITSIKEYDILQRMSHPHIVKLISANLGSPFNRRLSPLKDRETKTDDLFFIFERANCDLESIMKRVPKRAIKLIICHALLGLEYMHNLGIVHRDIKPGNLLYFEYENVNDDGFDFMVKLCDFGMCKFYDPLSEQTPGVSTYAFRAPEIVLGNNYDYKADIWSIGAIMYELLFQTEFITCKDSHTEIIKNIFTVIPKLPTWKEFTEMCQNQPKMSSIASVKRHYNKVSKKKVDKSSEISFLSKLLTFNPAKRPNASEALDDAYFDDLRNYINRVRKIPVPVIDDFRISGISEERKTLINSLISNFLDNFHKFPWINLQMIFHVIDLFEHYLQKPKDYSFKLVAFVCIYACVKFFTTMYRVPSFSEIVPEDLVSPKNLELAQEVERYILLDLLGGKIYRKTIYEYFHDLGAKPSIDQIKTILQTYSTMDIKDKNYREIAVDCLNSLNKK